MINPHIKRAIEYIIPEQVDIFESFDDRSQPNFLGKRSKPI